MPASLNNARLLLIDQIRRGELPVAVTKYHVIEFYIYVD